MSWNKVTLTECGETLLSSMLNGAKLTFTRVELGGETVPDEQLPGLTSVNSPISAPALIAGQSEVESRNGTQINIQIRNEGVEDTTRMKQIGLFAKTEHCDEVMIGILQDEIGEEIPSYSEFPFFGITLQVVVSISRTNNIRVVVSPFVYVTKAEYDAAIKELTERVENSETQLTLTPISLYDRSTDKPDYSSKNSGELASEVTLHANDYTGNTEVAITMSDGVQYDAENISRDAETAPNGNLILEEE